MDEVSVIIPYYNRRSTIDECLASVFSQTLPPAQVIVVDDASRDEERRYLERFVPRIEIVSLARNRGAAGARNAGIAAARGQWVAFLDDDDAWEADKLAVQQEYLRQNPECAGVHSAIRTFRQDGRESVSGAIPSRLRLEDALRHNLIRVQSLMIRADVLRALGGFDERFRICEDDDLGIRLALGGYRIDFLPQPLTRMRRGHGDHLFGDPYRMVWWKTLLAMHHRELLERTLGRGATRRRIALSVRKAGAMRGGCVGKLLFLAGWGLGGCDATDD